MRMAAAQAFCARRIEQRCAHTKATQFGGYHQIVDIGKAPIEQIFAVAHTGQPNELLAVKSPKQPVALLRLPPDLLSKRVGVNQVRPKLAHELECGVLFGAVLQKPDGCLFAHGYLPDQVEALLYGCNGLPYRSK
ncbi:protein of unknown function [Pseudomonas sp. JV241A]|nr:protein of unknown function [Pseudomonas sp. JV241A]